MEAKLPIWLDPGIEPPDSLRTTGWQEKMKPAPQYFNWFFNRTYLALKELQENGDIADLQSQVDALKTIFTEHSEENASLTTRGHTQLSNAFDSTSDTLAATPSAVKQAYDRGNEAYNDMAELRVEFLAFKAALTEGFTDNQFSDGLTSLNALNVTAGYYNLPLTRLEV